jgi:Tol biopolymer transport system component
VIGFYQRIVASSLLLALLTGLLAWFGFRQGDVRLIARSPEGQAVAASSTIRLTFSRPVDRRSVEESFRLEPTLPGRFFWEDATLVFRPEQPLQSSTAYTITLSTALRDAQGRANESALAWSFRTRAPQLLALRDTETGGELWLVPLEGGAPRRIIAETQPISAFAVAPDGSQAIYVVERSPERTALMLLDLADGTTRPLADDPEATATAPAWASTDDLVVYERRALVNGSLGVSRLWLTQPDATQLGPLIGADDGITYGAVWSPDGYRIALIDGSTQAVVIYDFFSDQRRNLPVLSSEPVSWLADGSGFVFSDAQVGPEGPALRLRRFDLASEQVSDLTAGGAAEIGPMVAPDGTFVAYSEQQTDSPGSVIKIVASEGGTPRALTEPGPHRDDLPIWSPDSKRIAFIRDALDGTVQRSAWVVARDGGPPTMAFDNVIQVGWAP